MRLIQINLQPHFGGGEVFTAFLCRALDRLGVATELIHHANAGFWRELDLPASTRLTPVANAQQVPQNVPRDRRHWLLSHGPIDDAIARQLREHHLLTAIAHMPPQDRPRDRYPHCRCVFGVSNYVVRGLLAQGIPTWETALYGVADLNRGDTEHTFRQTSPYDWDRRKARDRLLGSVEPLVEPLRRRPAYARRAGITLGIVSRLTPIKQFPALFTILAPVIAAHEGFVLDVFGAGGYASVRDLRRALRPLAGRVRFWGHQANVAAIYPQLDYLMTGLPEKEALGLNIIEAQACGTPVLAVDAPPFDETVIDEVTGLRYPDPRHDGGAGFARLLDRLGTKAFHPDPVAATAHLDVFSVAAFDRRIARLLDHIKTLG